MKQYIGIDLGTTNSVIASFDGMDTRIWKSPEQNDVTPSAIYVDRHGRRFFGRRAYEMAPADEKNAATLFKRYLGTNMIFTLENSGETLTPEECSAEILRLLYSYLPREWQESADTGVVITVPAAFNQVKKDATLRAAEAAHIGNVVLMQEPVAAVMSVMKGEPIDGIFVVYDLGGGTFDISVAEHAGGQVNLLAQGGKEMCGGRDWDRLMWRQLVYPWLRQHFHLPDDADSSKEYRRLRQLALFACEQAKIELSFRKEAYIQMDESRIAQKDLDGKEIYLDIPVTQEKLTGLISDLLAVTVETSRDTIHKAGIRNEDIRKIVFIGGPTVYPPLQNYIMDQLKISEKGKANPMTAVAEGAGIYAESIDWSSRLHGRKDPYQRTSESDYEINYEKRVSSDFARAALIRKGGGAFSAEVISEVDGWTSGRVSFRDRGILQLPLKVRGENKFCLHLFDERDQPVALSEEHLLINRVAASVNAIPSTHSIALKVLESVGGKAVPVYLVRENDHLPKRGSVTLRAGRRLLSGSNESLVFTLWEGEIEDPVDANRYIGTYRIPGLSIPSGVIQIGADIVCEYEINESGNLQLGVTVPSVGAVFPNQNYYSSAEGQVDLEDPSAYLKTANQIKWRALELMKHLLDSNLIRIIWQLDEIQENLQSEDPETVQQAVNELLERQRDLARYRQTHLREVRVIDLNSYRAIVESYRDEVSEYDMNRLEMLYDSARRAIDHQEEAYETILQEYRVRSWRALEKTDRFIRDQFISRIHYPENYSDPAKFHHLKAEGMTCIENHDYQKLKEVIGSLNMIEKADLRNDEENMFENVNVLK